MKPTLIVMVKAPRLGRVKTRLGRDIGAVPATWWYRHQVARTLRVLRNRRWQMVLAVDPDTAVTAPYWPANLPRAGQGGGDLGARMARLLDGARGPVVLIGSDIPGLTRDHIAEAFDALGQSDAVFGPAEDGGFWLIGLKHLRATPRGFFRNVRWSHPETLADSIASLHGLSHQLIRPMRDIDTGADLAAFQHDANRRP